MGEFRVHHIRFFEYTPKSIQCLAYDETKEKIALSRSDGSIEVWDQGNNWFQEKILPATPGHSVEALVWCNGRLFSAGLHGSIHEHDLLTLAIKDSASSNSGAIWCLALNDESCSHIAAGTEDGCVVIFKITAEGIEYSKALDRQEGRILCIAWYTKDELIVTGGVDNIRIWNVNSGHAIQRLTLARQETHKETIVWAIAVTSDFTIISGDSRGKTNFWNGRQGTQIKSIQSHKADVLALGVNKAGTSVFSSGIDPNLVQFEYITQQPDSAWKMWVRSHTMTQHSHDVRAVAVTNKAVVSGGVDCQLIINHLEGVKGIKKWKRIPPIPHVPMAYTAVEAKLVMLRYSDYLELWRLGSTNKTSEKDGEYLALKAQPIKLLQLKSREHITCGAISSSASWLAYSDCNSVRLFHLAFDEAEVSLPKVSVQKVRYSPPGTLPAHCLAFTPEGSILVSATCQGNIQLLKVDEVQPCLLHTFPSPIEPSPGIHLLSVSPSGEFIATGDHSNKVHVYNIKKKRLMCCLPTSSHQPTAIGFHPTAREVLVAYCNQTICEYNFTQKEYSGWSRKCSKKWHPDWLRRLSKITQVMYHPHKPHQIFCRDEQMFCIIDKTQPFPGEKDRLFGAITKKDASSPSVKHAFHICQKFKFLLHLDILEDDFLLVVERPQLAIMDNLPPTLKQKKFGT